jgi:hypothetical protein
MATIIDMTPAASPIYRLNSVSERRDLPVASECIPPQENALYATRSGYWCQDGCDEKPFAYLVDPDDIVQLQFHGQDTVNDDPMNPEVGWRTASGDYFIELEVVALDGTVLWSGDTSDISTVFYVAHGPNGPYQFVAVNMEMLRAQVAGLPECFYFRAKVFGGYEPINSVNATSAPVTAVPIGWRYLDFDTNTVQEQTAGGFVQIGPNEVGEVWYDVSTGTYYRWQGASFVSLPGPPRPEASLRPFAYFTTMTYRFVRCGEPTVRFRSIDSGTDCTGFYHDVGTGLLGTTVSPATEIGAWSMIADFPIIGTEGAVVLNQFDGTVYRLQGGVWVAQPTPADGSLWSVMNGGSWAITPLFSGSVPPGAIMEYDTTTQQWVDVSYSTEAQTALELIRFQHDFRVSGTAEVDALPIERELTKNGRLVSRRSMSSVRVRTTGVPEVVARRISAVLAAKSFWIDERELTEADGLRKNNEEGLHWWPDFTVRATDCDVQTSCD